MKQINSLITEKLIQFANGLIDQEKAKADEILCLTFTLLIADDVISTVVFKPGVVWNAVSVVRRQILATGSMDMEFDSDRLPAGLVDNLDFDPVIRRRDAL